MKSIKELRKEKQDLASYSGRCRYYISLLNEKMNSLARDYHTEKLSREQYHEMLERGLNGRSFRHYINTYNSLIRKYDARLEKLEKEIAKAGKRRGIAVTALILAVLMAALYAVNQPNITGKVVFSTVEGSSDILDIEFNRSAEFVWQPENSGRLNSVSLSGEYIGNGSLKIYLEIGEESKLIYAAESSSAFESECGNACYLYDSSQDEYTIRVEMPEGNELMLERMDYFVSELEEFRISPSNVTVNLAGNRFVKNKFEIYNTRNRNFSAAIYAEGELTEHVTLYRSYADFDANESVKEVRYDIDLPLDIKPGKYEEKIIVRYLPEQKFRGEAPKEEHKITVIVKAEKELPSPGSNHGIIIVAALFLILWLNVVMFLKGKISH
ncbi:hypothetical protein GF323_00795 [Candidatus Woesearchaeota archaeon]|nr:hypothetical protein [Candidatus Woesearchaeota archaeon]